MFCHFLAASAAKAAMENQPKKIPVAKAKTAEVSSSKSHSPGPHATPAMRRLAATPTTQASSSASGSQFRIPDFSLDKIIWNNPGCEMPISDETTTARESVLSTINECLAKQNTPATIANYESIMNIEVGNAEKSLDTTLLPLDSEVRFLSLFGFMRFNNPNLKWSRVRALKSALMKYHTRNKLNSVLDVWTPQMSAMWAGLSRMASHEQNGKDPIDFAALMSYLGDSEADPNPATQRFRAMAVVGFFGVRRCAEILQFRRRDATWVINGDIHLYVRCQKNDQAGIGMVCVIPSIPALGSNSPALILDKWMQIREDFMKTKNPDEPLFLTITGTKKTIGNRVSADSFRKAVTNKFSGNTATHSLRKGGARFYAKAQAPEQATRDQGGWRTSETMKEIYTALTKDEVHSAIHEAANTAGNFYVLKELAQKMKSFDSLEETAAAKLASEFCASIIDAIGVVEWPEFVQLKIGITLKGLFQHKNKEVSSKAIRTSSAMRHAFLACQAKKRKVE
tara:strand:+ start:153 stop:1682 length:1530 start_codon:yes stop_codon:yes gene_type:complete